MSTDKSKQSSSQLIEHMKEKGIKFNIVNEVEAQQFLENNNYYFKLAAYRNNYEKNSEGKYLNLDFAYLKELSIIDMELRYLILQMALDIEHFIKVKILNDIEKNDLEDGYNIVTEFCSQNERVNSTIDNHAKSEYCRKLIQKHKGKFPLWAFVEVISFGDTIKLYEFYCRKYGTLQNWKLLYPVRDIRNAAAHSNCLIYNLEKNGIKTSPKIINYVKSISTIGEDMRKNKLSNKLFSDFATLIYVYDSFVTSDSLKQKRAKELQYFFEQRMKKNQDFFIKNDKICSAYIFGKCIIDNFVEKILQEKDNFFISLIKKIVDILKKAC
ncbi:Abi family protein [Fusobacterium necrophorum]|uniref:Abi family protein n=2 Tax=Fusobacterium necrophorum TaxID=859 RepID=UPI00254B518A|nr:Abi family protein [Fusobacterium necrophorum]MDK4483564.1 Abi family protein [Fusobacterium necrophorum]MDK4499985.1 Abi family protein [Fusobacterium necrophorum]MDK4507991.1 Abi family protein [Fusobacterium necrophorum]